MIGAGSTGVGSGEAMSANQQEMLARNDGAGLKLDEIRPGGGNEFD